MPQVPEKTGNQPPAGVAMSPGEAFLLSLVDGVTAIEDLGAACGMDEKTVQQALEKLLAHGLIRFRDAPSSRVKVGQMGLERIKLGETRRDEVAQDHVTPLWAAREALDRNDLAAAREHVNTAWMIAPEDPEVLKIKAELDARLPRTPSNARLAAVTEKLKIPAGEICKHPQARSLLMQAAKKVQATDYAGAAKDLQMAVMFEKNNPELNRFRDDVERLRKGP